MHRRHFCQALAGTAVATALGAQTARAATSAAWTQAYVGLQADVEPLPLAVKGRLPAGLQGAFLRNGPARHGLGGMRYHHWFDGDGMLQRYTLSAAGIVHDGRFVRTAKFVADSSAGWPVRPAFGTAVPGGDEITAADDMNVANTSVVQHAGELMALWEGGSATVMDPRTLATRGPKVWSPDYAGVAFSAHPKIEPDGTMWNFGISSLSSQLSIYRVGADGRLAQAHTQKVADIAMVHDFAVTARHLVFLLPPLVFDRQRALAGQTFLDSHVWRPHLGLRVLVLAKDALDRPLWFQLPAGFVFHIGNAWEDGKGMIRLDFMRTDSAWHATTGLAQVMAGRFEDHEHAKLALLTLSLGNGRAQVESLPQIAEFPRIDPRVVGRRHQQLFSALRLNAGERPGHDAVMRMDLDSGRIDHFRYGAEVMVEEHVFVPRPGSRLEGDGWLLGTAIDLKARQMLFSVFDAQHLADGPLMQGRLDRLMPLGLHGIFVST